jgi:NDP-sugar pyrophosphorylase family protein
MQAIILAGGKGTRLKPFTTNIPKPLIPIGEMPILEIVLRQLKYFGFTDIILSVNHLADIMMAFFRDGEKFGLNISYSVEDKILGTAGPLSIIDNLDDNFLVMNGDLLTTLNYKKFFDFHEKNKNEFSISTYKKDLKIDLGVLEIEDGVFKNYFEKPVYKFDVSMGVYVVNKNMVSNVPKNEKMDMPDFILKLHKNNNKIACYSESCYWLDIGRVDDYEKSLEIFEERKEQFLPK